MAIFKDTVIVLNKQKQSKWNDIYFVFSKQYWKIICSKKPEKNKRDFWTGTEISVEIEVKENINIHNIRNPKIISEFNYEWLSFILINKYLEIIAYCKRNFPDFVENEVGFNVLKTLNKVNITKEALLLTHLKLIDINWELPIESDDITTTKILKFVRQNQISNILRLTNIPEYTIKKLEEFL